MPPDPPRQLGLPPTPSALRLHPHSLLQLTPTASSCPSPLFKILNPPLVCVCLGGCMCGCECVCVCLSVYMYVCLSVSVCMRVCEGGFEHILQCARVSGNVRACMLACRANNLVLVKFGFSALSVPRFLAFSARFRAQNFKKCSFSAPEIQRTLCQMMMMGKTTYSDSFHWKKWIDLQHLERLQQQRCCTAMAMIR